MQKILLIVDFPNSNTKELTFTKDDKENVIVTCRNITFEDLHNVAKFLDKIKLSVKQL